MGKRGNKSAPSTPAKGQNGKASVTIKPQARKASQAPAGNNVMSDLEEQIVTSVLMALVFSAVFVGADNVLHAKFGKTMEASEMLTRGAICWIPLIPIAFVTTRYLKNWVFRAFLFAATSAIAQQMLQLAHSGTTENQLKYGPYFAIYWGWCFFKMPFPDALLSMFAVVAYAIKQDQVTVPPHVEAKLRFLQAEFERRTGYKLPL